jgi:hypothetical protein
MRQEIPKELDELQQKIESGDFVREARSVKQWGGADVIINRRLTDQIKKWQGDQPLVISFQETEPRRRAVITEYSKELSWLFYELKAIFAGEIDHVSKYDFYGLLAQSALDYLDAHKENVNCGQLLTAVLDMAKSFCEE